MRAFERCWIGSEPVSLGRSAIAGSRCCRRRALRRGCGRRSSAAADVCERCHVAQDGVSRGAGRGGYATDLAALTTPCPGEQRRARAVGDASRPLVEQGLGLLAMSCSLRRAGAQTTGTDCHGRATRQRLLCSGLRPAATASTDARRSRCGRTGGFSCSSTALPPREADMDARRAGDAARHACRPSRSRRILRYGPLTPHRSDRVPSSPAAPVRVDRGRARSSALGFRRASTWVHYQILHDPFYSSVCDVNATFSCTEAYTSRFGSIGGVPVALIGVLYFAFVLALIALCRRSADGAPESCRAMCSRCRRSDLPASCISRTRRSSFSKRCACSVVGTYAAIIALFLIVGSGDQVSHDAVFPAGRRAMCARSFALPRR